MAISKAMRAALGLLSYPEIDVKKTYLVEREIQKLLSRRSKNPSLYRTWEHPIPCGVRNVPARIFTPAGPCKALLLFFHGGGWVTGTVDSYDGVCSDMAAMTGCTVVSVDYRLAPEHRFPAAPEDCYAAAREVFRCAGLLGVRQEDIVLTGDSAGGNLAAAVSLMARDRGEFRPHRQILIYPALSGDHSENSPYPSVRENGAGYLLTSRRVQDYLELYRSSDSDLTNPYFAPLNAASFSDLPDTLLITAEYCLLRDEGEAYGKRLQEAGGRVEIHRIPDALHGYFSLPVRFAQVRRTYEIINRFLEGSHD
ncbi:MAG: alpha/beta hydrolase [Oscillibacter sp.]|nr:alpha/beta hydrolase [Oscillibacter sp.]